MEIIEGIYASAGVFLCSNSEHGLDPYAAAQLKNLCDDPASEGTVIRVMPDVHPGKVCTIGLTMTTGERVIPQGESGGGKPLYAGDGAGGTGGHGAGE